MELQTPKGTRDFPPEEKILKDRILNTLKSVFELYGYAPLETPIFEKFDVLSSKYAGGSEILKETFKFRDQGDRELALRYDLTVPFSRFIGMNPNLKMPFKRYQIGEVFRDGPARKFCDLRARALGEFLERFAFPFFQVNHGPYFPHGANCA